LQFKLPRDPVPRFPPTPAKVQPERRGLKFRKLTADAKIPPSWKAFSSDNTSHKDLFSPLTDRVANFKFPEIKEVSFASDESVVESRGSTFIQKCVP